MEEFLKQSAATLAFILESQEYKECLKNQAKVMKLAHQQYMLAGFTHDEAVQLVIAQADSFKVTGG